ncbi:MAG: dependent oxidoreductase [Firmicutes bacterium]|nr:dependent oxidoreductase [Bacillota bacterium]
MPGAGAGRWPILVGFHSHYMLTFPESRVVAGATVKEIRIGLRPASPDTLPILGRAPALANLYLATGHGASGLLLGPYSGAAVADLIQGKALAADLTPFGPGRFRATT